VNARKTLVLMAAAALLMASVLLSMLVSLLLLLLLLLLMLLLVLVVPVVQKVRCQRLLSRLSASRTYGCLACSQPAAAVHGCCLRWTAAPHSWLGSPALQGVHSLQEVPPPWAMASAKPPHLARVWPGQVSTMM
jgi:hypothetical protein